MEAGGVKPATAAGYQIEQLEQVRSVCLYIATKLADLRGERGAQGLGHRPRARGVFMA